MSNVELKGLKGLRGLNILATDATTLSLSNERVEKIPHHLLVPGKYQPRKHIDEAVLNELADSIKTQGIIQPLIVRKIDSDKYEIIAGERRWRAAKIAALTHVPVIIREIEDNVAFAFAIIENIQRENLNPIEEALAFARFRDEFLMKHDEIANMVGRSRTFVTNAMRLLMLEPDVKNLLGEGRLDIGHAKVLLSLSGIEQVEVANKVVLENLNVRQTENIVKKTKEGYERPAQDLPLSFDKAIREYENSLENMLHLKSKIKINSDGKGSVKINFDSVQVLEWFIKKINEIKPSRGD